ncbi:hypothetical protein [Gelidibacter gilvus]|uniref:Uncharacterized protein n=1 Tax=Gelidibacter gilvus TaxID=59602 RepID=A0A4V1LN32_9FLAO|nr:hypothetical protein [Gelidibacter gilvus]RXJ50676.1 hypothetical protein ESZ48_07935 [Gelidibacter gilvus]
MKKLILLIVLVPFFAFNNQSNSKDFVGKWIGGDKNGVGAVIFDKEGYAAFEIGEQTIGGKDFVMNDKRGQMTYSINMDTEPIQIDFTLTKLDSREQKILLAIAEFIDADAINFAVSFDDVRPASFNDDAIILTRVKPYRPKK